jgi:hypothetical protein
MKEVVGAVIFISLLFGSFSSILFFGFIQSYTLVQLESGERRVMIILFYEF